MPSILRPSKARRCGVVRFGDMFWSVALPNFSSRTITSNHKRSVRGGPDGHVARPIAPRIRYWPNLSTGPFARARARGAGRPIHLTRATRGTGHHVSRSTRQPQPPAWRYDTRPGSIRRDRLEDRVARSHHLPVHGLREGG